MRQLFHFIESYQKVPFKALKYLIGECNYGGRVTSLQDNRILSALLEDFLDDKVLEQGYSYFP
jgi:dynein heavy chain